MKTRAVSLALTGGVFSVLAAGISSVAESPHFVNAPAGNSDSSAANAPDSRHMKMTIGDRVFTVTLQHNATAAAFKTLLPLSLNMHDVNRNEKAFDLLSDLPTADADPRTIRAGA